MKCSEVREYLSAFMDGEVPEGLRPGLDAHLADCPVCQAELAVMERLDAALAGLSVPVPVDLSIKMRRRLPRHSLPWFQTLALAVCLALGIFLGGSLTGTFYPVSRSGNGITSDVATLGIFQDYPQGSLGGAFSFKGEGDGSA